MSNASFCSICRSRGMVSVKVELEGYGPVVYAYKCGGCQNWIGRYDGLPFWTGYPTARALSHEVLINR